MKYLLSRAVTAETLEEKHRTSVQWRNGVLITDEPETLGGKDTGPDPYTLLLSSLLSCTLATLRMYIEHKGLAMPVMSAEANMYYRIVDGETITQIERKIDFGKETDSELQIRLLRVAENCPVSKMLKGNIGIETTTN